jgi:hypothetical protein
METVIRNALTLDRKLDTKNANTESLMLDFQRFGIDWWKALRARHAQNKERQNQLDRLNRARNAIVHGQADKIEALRMEGYPLALKTARRWRKALDELAGHMDSVLSDALGKLFQRPPPW